MKVLTNLDLGTNPTKNLVIESLNLEPSNPIAGRLYFDLNINKLKLYDGSQWLVIESYIPNTNVYGTNFQYLESLTVSSVDANTNFQNKISLTTTDLPNGLYQIEIFYGFNHERDATYFESQILLNSVEIGYPHTETISKNGGTFLGTGSVQKMYFSKKFHKNLSGINTLNLNYRTTSAGDISSIWDASISLFRVQ